MPPGEALACGTTEIDGDVVEQRKGNNGKAYNGGDGDAESQK
jgi:hypothetical protein